MSITMSVSEARAALPALLDRVGGGESVVITRHGKVAAVLVGPDAASRGRAEDAWAVADALGEALERLRGQPLPAGPGLSQERADELVAEVRAGRDRR